MKSILFLIACSFCAVCCISADSEIQNQVEQNPVEQTQAVACKMCNRPSCSGCGKLACDGCRVLFQCDCQGKGKVILAGCPCTGKGKKSSEENLRV